jgi:hypothetical protein
MSCIFFILIPHTRSRAVGSGRRPRACELRAGAGMRALRGRVSPSWVTACESRVGGAASVTGRGRASRGSSAMDMSSGARDMRERRRKTGGDGRGETRAEQLCSSNSEGRSEPAYWGHILPGAASLPPLPIQRLRSRGSPAKQKKRGVSTTFIYLYLSNLSILYFSPLLH